MITGGNTYRIISDERGSPRLIVDITSGISIQELDYDEYGNILTDSNPGFQPFGYIGGIYDNDTSLLKLGVREYRPATGSWVSKDPALYNTANSNLYQYCYNDPINYIDITGLDPWGGDAYGEAAALNDIYLESGDYEAAKEFVRNQGLYGAAGAAIGLGGIAVYTFGPEVAAICTVYGGYAASRITNTISPSLEQRLFGSGGWFNRGQAIRMGWSRHKGEKHFSIRGDWIDKIFNETYKHIDIGKTKSLGN
jgi:RHS repeat-associated protein